MADMTLPTDVAAARPLFPGAAEGPYLDVARRGLLSRPARAAIDRLLDEQLRGDSDKAALFATIERSRARFAQLIGAAAAEVAITKNVSEGLNAVAAFYWVGHVPHHRIGVGRRVDRDNGDIGELNLWE